MMSGVFALPRRSITIVLLSALVSLLRWLILVVIALLLAPHVLAHVEQPREVAFLSIDVVGSTAMKEREESAAVQYDFSEYRKLVEALFAAHGILKSAWTPDGVMGCFPDKASLLEAMLERVIDIAGHMQNSLSRTLWPLPKVIVPCAIRPDSCGLTEWSTAIRWFAGGRHKEICTYNVQYNDCVM
jgi:class 3 adenylate cyclase